MIVRESTKEYIEKIKMETLKKALIEQCEDTAKLNLEICNDFKYVDGEQERYEGKWDCHTFFESSQWQREMERYKRILRLPRTQSGARNDRKGMTK